MWNKTRTPKEIQTKKQQSVTAYKKTPTKHKKLTMKTVKAVMDFYKP